MKLLICLPAFVFALLLALLPSPVSAQALCTSTGEIFFHMVDCCGNGMVDAASCKGEPLNAIRLEQPISVPKTAELSGQKSAVRQLKPTPTRKRCLRRLLLLLALVLPIWT